MNRDRRAYRYFTVTFNLIVATSDALAPTRGSHVFFAPVTGAFISLRMSHN